MFILYSAADPTTASSEAGNGLFGTVLVQPPHAEYYRSQVLRTDLIDATYNSMNLPPNIVLRRRPQQPGESADAPPVWLLTTYKTRLHDFVLKNVEVDVIGEAEDIQRLTGALPQVMQAKTFLRRDLETGESIKLDHGPEEELRELQEKGEVIPEGNLYARSTRASADRLFNRLQGESRAAHRMAGPGDALSRGEGLAGGPNSEILTPRSGSPKMTSFTSSSRTPRRSTIARSLNWIREPCRASSGRCSTPGA